MSSSNYTLTFTDGSTREGDSIDSLTLTISQKEDVTGLVIGDAIESIGDSEFRGYSALTSVTIPNSVTSIGNLAFYYCSSLQYVTIGDSVTSIGDSAFNNCVCLLYTSPSPRD